MDRTDALRTQTVARILAALHAHESYLQADDGIGIDLCENGMIEIHAKLTDHTESESQKYHYITRIDVTVNRRKIA